MAVLWICSQPVRSCSCPFAWPAGLCCVCASRCVTIYSDLSNYAGHCCNNKDNTHPHKSVFVCWITSDYWKQSQTTATYMVETSLTCWRVPQSTIHHFIIVTTTLLFSYLTSLGKVEHLVEQMLSAIRSVTMTTDKREHRQFHEWLKSPVVLCWFLLYECWFPQRHRVDENIKVWNK